MMQRQRGGWKITIRLSFLYVCMVNTIYLLYSTDEDPSSRIESSAIINLRGVSTKLNKYNNTLVSGTETSVTNSA